MLFLKNFELFIEFRVSDGSGNPLWSKAQQRLQRTARPSVTKEDVVTQIFQYEGTPKRRNFNFA
jgi:hypothetical protein